MSVRLGAIVAGASERQVAALGAYGDALGLAFQVTDDLLDASGATASVGKRTGKDIERGKLTYPGQMGVESSRAYAAELIAEAHGALEPFGEGARELHALADRVLERDH